MARKTRPVRFEFKGHPESETYTIPAGIFKKIKAIVVEDVNASMQAPQEELREKLLNMLAFTRFDRSELKAFKRAIDAGKHIEFGETAETREEMELYNKVWRQSDESSFRAKKKPNLFTIEIALRDEAYLIRLRHEMIQKTLQRLLGQGKTPVFARYGAIHSLLSRELRQEGMESSRKIQPLVFDWHERLLRKILASTRYQKEFHSYDLFRAHVSRTYKPQLFKAITGRPLEKADDKMLTLYTLVENALLGSGGVAEGVALRKDPEYLLKMHNLPERPTAEQLVQLLEKKSVFWRRQRAANDSFYTPENISRHLAWKTNK